MIKRYAINQKRLKYLEKTVKLIDIANRIDDRLQDNDAKRNFKSYRRIFKSIRFIR